VRGWPRETAAVSVNIASGTDGGRGKGLGVNREKRMSSLSSKSKKQKDTEDYLSKIKLKEVFQVGREL